MSPLLLSALADTRYSRRIRELREQRKEGGQAGEKLTWWDVRMNKVPDTAVSGAFTGGVLNAWKRTLSLHTSYGSPLMWCRRATGHRAWSSYRRAGLHGAPVHVQRAGYRADSIRVEEAATAAAAAYTSGVSACTSTSGGGTEIALERAGVRGTGVAQTT